MGGGSWTTKAFDDYSIRTRGISSAQLDSMNFSAQEFYRTTYLKDSLNPKNVIRECCDSEEHPNTLPVILALDVTGSMGSAAVRVAKKLNKIMTDLYANPDVKDIEFCVMGIGDLRYDNAPIQISQFESDVRIAEQMDDIFFEGGGGGNSYESYTAAWYMGTNCCKLDCWNRGKKGVIITLGDENPNPYLPAGDLSNALGIKIQADVETKDLYAEASKLFNIYHLSVNDEDTCYNSNARRRNLDEEWKNLVGENNYFVVTLDSLDTIITDIIQNNANGTATNTNDAIGW